MELVYKKFIQNLNLPTAGEVIFFPGSFNPIHKGHMEIINRLPLDIPLRVIYDRNPQKELNQINKSLTDQILNNRNKNIMINDDFLKIKEKKNYTFNWIDQIFVDYPNLKISLAMGFDQLNNFLTWYKAEDLLKMLTKIYWLSRNESEKEKNKALNQIKKCCPQIQLIPLGQHSYEGLSSSQIREKAALKND